MGNHKFRLSNIIPNSWFYKLKETGRRSNTSSNQHHATPPPVQVPCNSRKSYHFTRNLNSRSSDSPVVDPPRKSSRKKRPTTTQSSSSSSAACSCATVTVHSVRSKLTSTTTTTTSSSLDNLVFLPPELHSFDRMVACSTTSCHTNSDSPVADEEDVVIGVDKMSPATKTQETLLPPIKTEHKKFSELVREIGGADEEEEEEEETPIYDKPNKQRKSPARRISTSSSSPRIRIRVNSPRLSRRVETKGAGRKSMSRRRKSLKSPDSMAVVKSSADPEKDFRESMVEMIVENEIRAAKDLEELLACYLSLNSIEHHHLIVQVFTQIWFDLNRIH